MNFDAKYEEILDTITEGIYELAETFAEEQINNFAKFLAKKSSNDPYNTVDFNDLAEQFIAEQKS